MITSWLLLAALASAEGNKEHDALRQACMPDVQRLCPGSDNPGLCIEQNWNAASEGCRQAKLEAKRRWQAKHGDWQGKKDGQWQGKKDGQWQGQKDGQWQGNKDQWQGKQHEPWQGNKDGQWQGKKDEHWQDKKDGQWKGPQDGQPQGKKKAYFEWTKDKKKDGSTSAP